MSAMFTEDQFFQHRYGGIYQFIRKVRYSDRQDEGVLYMHLWPFEKGSWVRPIEEWTEDRFTPISPGEATIFIDSMTRSEAQEFIKANKQSK